MRTFPRSLAAGLAACCAAAAIAGCASAAAPVSRSTPAAAGTGQTSLSSSPSTGTPRQQAEADAALLVKAFVPPPGARAVPRSPVPSSPLSAGPQGGSPEDADVVIRTGWWLAPGGPRKLLSWEAAHLSRYRNNGSGMNGPGVYNEFFEVPAVPGLFDERQLTVSAVAAGHGQVALRVDAMVDWIPARAPGDTVPATAKVAVLTETRDAGGRGKPRVVATATLTDVKKVAALAAYLNGLPVNPPGETVNCPAAVIDGGRIAVAFRDRPAGPALAGATATFAGCAFLSFTMPGQKAAEIGGPAAGNDLLAEVNRVAGLHWKVP